MSKKLSVVVPCFNESLNIETTFERIKTNLNKITHNYEIIFVDDGSTDSSIQILEKIAHSDKNLKILQFSRNFGHQSAMFAGIEFSSGDGIFLIDADLQDPPEKFQEMYEKWLIGYDVVYGVRKSRERKSFLRKFLYSSYHKVFKLLSDLKNQEDLTDFCLMDVRVKNEIIKLRENNVYFRGLRSWVGFKQIGIPYEQKERQIGETKYSISKLFQLALDGILNFSIKPLNYIFIVGVIMFFLSLVSITFFLLQKLFGFSFLGTSPEEAKGFFVLIIVILFFGGINLTALGIIGEYVGRLYREVKDRPKYIIQKKINFK